MKKEEEKEELKFDDLKKKIMKKNWELSQYHVLVKKKHLHILAKKIKK